MHVQRSLLILMCLALTAPAYGQRHGAAHSGGARQGVTHPSQIHPQQMSPEMHHEMMMQQFWHEQMMFSELMSQPAAGYRPKMSAARRVSADALSGLHDSSSGVVKVPLNASTAGVVKVPLTPSNSQTPNPVKQPGAKKLGSATKQPPSTTDGPTTPSTHNASPKAEKTAAEHKNDEAQSHRTQIHEHAKGRRGRSGDWAEFLNVNDQSTVSLLKQAMSEMRRADHDYQGHRVRSMEHVSSALEHLGAAAAINSDAYYSAGNLPQSQSDELLRAARLHLTQVHNTLTSGNNTYTYHHHARDAVAAAIHELHLALNVN